MYHVIARRHSPVETISVLSGAQPPKEPNFECLDYLFSLTYVEVQERVELAALFLLAKILKEKVRGQAFHGLSRFV
jgi:hypothetical protein